ncbi:MAG: tryptophanase [Candidatus Parcubacteria bacterium]|nr:tryptophanase [Candidatus Parcubacteria bacterium]
MTDTSRMLELFDFKPEHQYRPYVNSAVRFHMPSTREDRLAAAIRAGWNVFQFPSKMTFGDLLSDSGTTTPTIEQLAMSLLGDEAYGTNWGYEQLLERFEQTFGITLLGDNAEWEIFLFHQCRAAEHALFTQIGRGENKGNLIIPSNGHFDTTHANIAANKMEALDIPAKRILGNTNIFVKNERTGIMEKSSGLIDIPMNSNSDFLGNIDIFKLQDILNSRLQNVPMVYCTVTNNTMAGQPVSLDNINTIARLCKKAKKPFFLDACRFAENAWFIKERERKDQSVLSIVHEMFSSCDGFTISLKKDGLSNMGGALCVKKGTELTNTYPNIMDDLRDHQICTEGHPTYGGMSGRDIMIIVEGLKTVVTEEYLRARVGQVRRFGEYLDHLGIPVVKPFGGHAVYLEMDKFFEGTTMRPEHFGGISLTALLLLSGPRLCELGSFAFGSYDPITKTETPPPFNYVRAAIPRLKYEDQDLFFVADCIKNLYDKRDILPRAIPVYGREKNLRHFKARFELESR